MIQDYTLFKEKKIKSYNEIKSHQNEAIKKFFTFEGVKKHEFVHFKHYLTQKDMVIQSIPSVIEAGNFSHYAEAKLLYDQSHEKWLPWQDENVMKKLTPVDKQELEAYYVEWLYYNDLYSRNMLY